MDSPKVINYLAFVDAMAIGDNKALAGLIDTERFVTHLPGGPEEGMDFSLFVAELQKLRTAFPNFAAHKDYDNFLEHGSHLVVTCDMEMTHGGPLAWPPNQPALDATGKQAVMSLVEVIVFDPDDKIIRFNMMGDRLSVVEQLGA